MQKTIPPELSEWIAARFSSRAAFGRPLAKFTTLYVGGPAEVLVRVGDKNDLRDLVIRADRGKVPLTVLGRGSNVLISDAGLSGIVVRLSGEFARIEVEKEWPDSVVLSAGAAVPLPGLCLFAARRGLSGLGFAAGIPGSVGGAVMGNAGAHGAGMSDVISGFFITRPDGSRKWVEKDVVSWRYRGFDPDPAVFGGKGAPSVITHVRLLLGRSIPEELLAMRRLYLAQRAATQPTREKSAGCFFKNPASGPSAGELIDRAGLKGMSMGGARVSITHANYFVNTGNATATDFMRLMAAVKEEVFRRYGISLEPEVKVLA